MHSLSAPPFTVDTLAERWGCSPGAIRNRIRSGEIHVFRIGTLIRIPANEVEKIECPNMLSSASGEGLQSSGTMATESGIVRLSPRLIASEPKPKPVNLGDRLSELRGPWDES